MRDFCPPWLSYLVLTYPWLCVPLSKRFAAPAAMDAIIIWRRYCAVGQKGSGFAADRFHSYRNVEELLFTTPFQSFPVHCWGPMGFRVFWSKNFDRSTDRAELWPTYSGYPSAYTWYFPEVSFAPNSRNRRFSAKIRNFFPAKWTKVQLPNFQHICPLVVPVQRTRHFDPDP